MVTVNQHQVDAVNKFDLQKRHGTQRIEDLVADLLHAQPEFEGLMLM